MAHRSHNRRRRSAGYTVIEVMMALAVLAIGATGIVAMQKATLLGTVRARNLSTANAVAQAWIERLKVDALMWKVTPSGSTIMSTTFLNVVGTDYPTISTSESVWLNATNVASFGYNAMSDVRGMDTKVVAQAAFCTNVRITQVMPNMIRAEVRVFWLKNKGTNQTSNAGTIGGKPLCADDAAYRQKVSSAAIRYHFVYLTTAILRTSS